MALNTKSQSLSNWLPLILGGLFIFLADQISKALVVGSLLLGQSWEPIPALAPIFKITHSTNTGAAFSMFVGGNLPLLLLSLVMAGGIVFFYPRCTNTLQRIALGLLLGGVLGNLFDRLRFGLVIDLIHWQIPGVISNVSNLADHGIVFGVVLLLVAQRDGNGYPSPHDRHEPTIQDAPSTPDRPVSER